MVSLPLDPGVRCQAIENPRGSPRGETESRFLKGHAGLRQLGLSFEASQPMTVGPRASAALRSVSSRRWTGGRPWRLETWEPASPSFRGPGVFSRALKSHFVARSISSSSPKSSALRSALCGIRPPVRPCGRDFRHTHPTPRQTSLQLSISKGYGCQGSGGARSPTLRTVSRRIGKYKR
jgi:hypothetical protein